VGAAWGEDGTEGTYRRAEPGDHAPSGDLEQVRAGSGCAA
jgi:hypothetical protein